MILLTYKQNKGTWTLTNTDISLPADSSKSSSILTVLIFERCDTMHSVFCFDWFVFKAQEMWVDDVKTGDSSHLVMDLLRSFMGNWHGTGSLSDRTGSGVVRVGCTLVGMKDPSVNWSSKSWFPGPPFGDVRLSLAASKSFAVAAASWKKEDSDFVCWGGKLMLGNKVDSVDLGGEIVKVDLRGKGPGVRGGRCSSEMCDLLYLGAGRNKNYGGIFVPPYRK